MVHQVKKSVGVSEFYWGKLSMIRKTLVPCQAWTDWCDPMAVSCASVCTDGMMRSATVGEQDGAQCENSVGASVRLLMEE